MRRLKRYICLVGLLALLAAALPVQGTDAPLGRRTKIGVVGIILTTLLGLLHAAEVCVVMQQHEWHGDGQTVLPAPYILLQLGLQHKARYGGC